MIRYDELSYGNLSGGSMDGLCAVQLELGGKRSTSVGHLARTILDFNRTRLLHVSGEFKHTLDEDLGTLFTVLSENGYTICAVVDSQQAKSWLQQVNYRIVKVSEKPWLLFSASEIHFQPTLLDPIEPPQLQAAHAKSSCYLDVSRDMTPRQVFDFLKRYPLWRLWSAPSKVYRMAVEVKEEEEA